MKNFLFIALLFSTMTACDKGDCNNAVKAEFKDLTGFDGCGMLIELPNGDRLEPLNLNEFDITPVDGQKIWVEYHTVSMASICMVGPTIEIDCISKR
jgi:hypothetical protein